MYLIKLTEEVDKVQYESRLRIPDWHDRIKIKRGIIMLNLDAERIEGFRLYLEEKERSKATIEKYMRDIRMLVRFCGETIRQKTELLAYKEHLIGSGYAIASINSMLASINSLLIYMKHPEWRMRYLKIQRSLFVNKDKELTHSEYMRMIEKAEEIGNERMAMLLQTICSTGIRISELRAITVESLKCRQARIWSKGKLRQILLPAKLCQLLKAYCKKRRIYTGMVFITRSGQAIDRSNLWKMMKRLAKVAGIRAKKVFPHNLRHLFAKTYYQKYRDIVRLADILGHNSMNTTRIYTIVNIEEQMQQMNQLLLLYDKSTT